MLGYHMSGNARDLYEDMAWLADEPEEREPREFVKAPEPDDFPSCAMSKPLEEISKEFWRGLEEGLEHVIGIPPEKVIFSGPCTIAIWPSGHKVIARCQDGDEYDREKGLMMCLLKKNYGSKAVDIIEQWL